MKNLLFLLALLICLLAYVRTEQPATWNSWMTQLRVNGAAAQTDSADSEDASAPAAPAPPPRTVPVGGLIKNGNFLSGGGYWEGDGNFDPSGKGIVVKLNPSTWTRVYQNFSGGQGAQYSIEVTYRVSPDLTLSTNPADYTDIGKRVQLDGYENYTLQGTPPGNFFGTVGEPAGKGVSYEYFRPRIGSTEVQDYQHTYPPVGSFGNKTFGLAFPPGTGTVTLVTAYVIDH